MFILEITFKLKRTNIKQDRAAAGRTLSLPRLNLIINQLDDYIFEKMKVEDLYDVDIMTQFKY